MPAPISQEALTAKINATAEASQAKLVALQAYNRSPAAKEEHQQALRDAADNSWDQGWHYAMSSKDQLVNLIPRDSKAAAQQAEADLRYSLANPASVASDRLSAAYENAQDAQGDTHSLAAAGQGIADTIKTISNDVTEAPDFMSGLGAGIDDAKALGGGIVRQVPNSIAPLAGMALGATIGAPLGAVGLAAGLWGGATLGNMASGQSELNQGLADKQRVDLLNTAQSEKFFEDNRGELLKENFIKSGIIGAVDTATIGLGGALLKAPLQAAERNVLARSMSPSDLLNPKLVASRLAEPAIKSAIAEDVGLLASKTGLGKAKSIATGVGLEMGSEGLGEYLGQYAATGVADPKSAVLEGLSSLGQATGTHMAVRAMNGAKDTAVVAKDAVVDKLKTTKEEQQDPTTVQEQEQQRQDHMDHVINTGDVSKYVDPQSTQNPVDGVISLAERIKNADKYVDSTNPEMDTTEKVVDDAHTKSEQILTTAKDYLVNLELRLNPEEIKVKIGNIERHLAGDSLRDEIRKTLVDIVLPGRQAEYDIASNLSNAQKEETQRSIDIQKTNIAKLSTQQDLLKQSVITDVAKDELVTSLGISPTAVPEIMRHAMKKRFDTKTLDLIDTLNTKAQEESGKGYFTDQEVGTLRSLKLSMRNQTMDEVNDNIRTGMDKHWSMSAYYNAFTKAVEMGDTGTINTLKPQLAKWDTGLSAKAEAVKQAAAEYKAEVSKYIPNEVSYDDPALHHATKSTAEKKVTPIVLARDAVDNTKWVRQNYDAAIDYKALGAVVIKGAALEKNPNTGLSLVEQINKDAKDVADFHSAITKMISPVSTSPTPSTAATQQTVNPIDTSTEYGDSFDAQQASADFETTQSQQNLTTPIDIKPVEPNSQSVSNTQPTSVQSPKVETTTEVKTESKSEVKSEKKIKLIPMDELMQRQERDIEQLISSQKTPENFQEELRLLELTHKQQIATLKKSKPKNFRQAFAALKRKQNQEMTDLNRTSLDNFEEEMSKLQIKHSNEIENNQVADITGLTLGKRRNENVQDKRHRNTTADNIKQKFGKRLLTKIANVIKSAFPTDTSNINIYSEEAPTNVVNNGVFNKEIAAQIANVDQLTEEQATSFNLLNKLTKEVKSKLETHLNSLGLKHENGSILHDVQVGSKRNEKVRNALNLTRDLSLDLFHANSDGTITMDENMATAFTAAIYSEVLGLFAMQNKDSDINARLGRNHDTFVPDALRKLFPFAMNTRDRVAHSIGKTITDLLGLENASNKTAYRHLNALRTALGARAIAVMEDLNYIKEVKRSEYALNIATHKNHYNNKTKKQEDSDKKKIHRFIHLNQTGKGIKSEAGKIIQDSTDSKRFITTLFDIQREADIVHTKPAKFEATPDVPEVLATELTAQAKDPFKVNSEGIKQLRLFDMDNIEAMAGVVQISDPANPNRVMIHADLEKSVTAQNNSIKQHINNFFGFLDGQTSLEDIQVYFLSEMWKQQRSGIINQIVNPQTDKVVRWFITNDSWNQEIKLRNRLDIDQADDRESLMRQHSQMTSLKWEARMAELEAQQREDIQIHQDAMEQFELAVATSFDLKNTKELNDKLNSPDSILQKAVNILVGSLDEGTNSVLSPEDQKIVVEAVKSVGTNMHAYSGLMALAQRQLAEAKGEASFVSTISSEADGKTNGVAITSFLFGTHESAEILLDFAKKYGIYTEQDGVEFFDEAKTKLGFDDIYMTIARMTVKALKVISDEGITYKEFNFKTKKEEDRHIDKTPVRRALTAIQHFTSNLQTDEGGPSSIMREMVKDPILMLFFGSAIKTATNNAAGAFLNKVKQFITDAYLNGSIDESSEKYSEKAKQYIVEYLNRLINFHGPVNSIPTNISGLGLMGWRVMEGDITNDASVFNEDTDAAIMKAHVALVGDAIASSLETTFKIFMDKADKFNSAAQVNGEIFQIVRDEMIKRELVKEVQKFIDSNGIEGIPTVDSRSLDQIASKVPLESLSIEAANTVDKILLDLHVTPMLHSDMSSQNPDNLEAGIILAKQQNKPDPDSNAKFEVLTNPLQQVEDRNQFDKGDKGRFSPMASIFESLGIGGIARVTHSTDGGVMTLAQTTMRKEELKAINVFDAIISGALSIQDATKHLNKAFFDVIARYSPFRELYNTTERMFIGLPKLELSQDTLNKISTIISNKGFSGAMEMLDVLDSEAKEADNIKLGALYQVGSVNQYSYKGSEYKPTPKDRAKLQKLIKSNNDVRDTTKVRAALVEIGMATEAEWFEQDSQTAINTKEVLQHLAQTLNTGYKKDAFKLDILKYIAPLVVDIQIKLVKTAAEISSLGLEGKLGEYHYKQGGSDKTIYLVDPAISGQQDLYAVLFHELIHAALSETMHINASSDPRAVKALKVLEDLMVRAKAINAKLKGKYDDAFVDIHEFVAYGLSDAEFQTEVLLETKGTLNLSSRMGQIFDDFVKALAALLGIKSLITAQGLGTMIREASLLIKIANDTKELKTIRNQEQATTISHSMRAKNYTTEEVYEALSGNNMSGEFNTHLHGLLNNIVVKLHGPFGIIHSQIKDTVSASESWKENVTPLTTELFASGLVVNDKSAFVMEQIYATVVKLNSDNEIHTFKPYGELSALYTSVFKTLTASDFLGSAFGTTTQAEAQALYDLVFKTSNVSNKHSDYLARFVAIGLTNPGINALLEQHTESTQSKETKTWAQKLQGFFEEILSYIHSWSDSSGSVMQSRVTGKRLDAIVTQLVKLELKQVQIIERNQKYKDSGMRTIEADLNKFAEKYVNKPILDLVDSDRFQKIRFKSIKGMGALAKTAAGHKFESFLEHTLGVLHLADNGKLGLIAGLINNVKGQKELFELLLLATAHNDNIRKTLMTHVAKNMLLAFKNKGKNLSIPQKNAITAVLLKTNVHSLVNTYSLQDLHEMLSDSSKIEQHLVDEANQLTGLDSKIFDQFMVNAHELGYYAATGKNYSEMLKKNVYQIIHSFGEENNRLTQTQLDKVEPIVSNLVSLYALKYTTENDKQAVAEILKSENARPDEEGNGIEFVLKFHEHMANVEKEYIYDSNPALASFGFIHEIFNPRTKLIAASLKDGKELMDAGYIQGDQIKRDPHDPDQTEKHYYILKYDSLGSYVSGAIQFGSNTKADDALIKGPIDIDSNEGRMNAAVHAKVNSDRTKTKPVRYTNKAHFRDMSKDPEVNYMAPIFDAEGQVLNWTYLMSENTKNNVLQRTNSFEKVLGTLAGSLQGKQNTVQQNEQVLTALFDEYQSTPAYKLSEFILVGPNATDKESREQWARLPDKTKATARKIFGSDHIMVSKYSIDMILGYRKVSMADPIHRLNKERAFAAEAGKSTKMVDMKSVSEIQKIGIMFIEEMLELNAKARGKTPEEAKRYARRAAMVVTRAEGVWQDIVSDLKDKIVVVSGSVLVGNIFSNVSRLVLEGIPLKNIAHYSLVAFKGATQYLKDKDELDGLLLQVKLGYDSPALQKQINILEDAIEKNPTTKLIEEGLLPTIVEDLDADTDTEYKSLLNDYIDMLSKNIPEPALKTLKTLMMSRESGAYKALAHVTQMSDFVARYTMYQFQTTKAEPMSHIDAVARANNAFVQYAMPMQRMMQYSDDMGFTLFTKYFLYIQREMARLYKEQPGRVISMAVFDKFINLGPMFIESSFIDHIGNWPFRDGALEWLNLHDKLLTTKALAAVL